MMTMSEISEPASQQHTVSMRISISGKRLMKLCMMIPALPIVIGVLILRPLLPEEAILAK